MRICIVLAALVLVAGCRPVQVTRQYYDEYVNPRASIDYEDTVSADIPGAFLDDYYAVDSKIVRLVDQIDLIESRLDDSWLQFQKSSNPWIKRLAIFDEHQLFVSGDDSLGYDPIARDIAAGLGENDRRIIVFRDGRSFLIHVAATGNAPLRVTLVELDAGLLTVEIPEHRTVLLAGGRAHGPGAGLPAESMAKLESTKSYSGRMRVDGQSWYWIRSMASDNLVYLFSERG